MPKQIALEVYSEAVNHWIIKTPGRQFPALVVQGDTFHGLYADLRDFADRLSANPQIDASLQQEAASIAESLRERLLDYERVVTNAGFRLPYTKSVA